MKTEDVRKYVRDRYAGIAKQGGSCCGPSTCCGASEAAEEASGRIGYTEEEMKSAPRGSNLGLGCGNPTALASLRAGETVLTWARERASTASSRRSRSVTAGKSSAST